MSGADRGRGRSKLLVETRLFVGVLSLRAGAVRSCGAILGHRSAGIPECCRHIRDKQLIRAGGLRLVGSRTYQTSSVNLNRGSSSGFWVRGSGLLVHDSESRLSRFPLVFRVSRSAALPILAPAGPAAWRWVALERRQLLRAPGAGLRVLGSGCWVRGFRVQTGETGCGWAFPASRPSDHAHRLCLPEPWPCFSQIILGKFESVNYYVKGST